MKYINLNRRKAGLTTMAAAAALMLAACADDTPTTTDRTTTTTRGADTTDVRTDTRTTTTTGTMEQRQPAERMGERTDTHDTYATDDRRATDQMGTRDPRDSSAVATGGTGTAATGRLPHPDGAGAGERQQEGTATQPQMQREGTGGGTLQGRTDGAAGQMGATTPATAEDAQLQARLEASLSQSEELSDVDINADVRGGVAHLEGEVATDTLRQKAEELAREVDGIDEVRNEIRVAGGRQ
jgi:osmotically-inducible protein OsmY